jgi:hypothetical protein
MPLHQAALAGRDSVVRLVERGARLDIRDKVYGGTPLGWAECSIGSHGRVDSGRRVARGSLG